MTKNRPADETMTKLICTITQNSKFRDLYLLWRIENVTCHMNFFKTILRITMYVDWQSIGMILIGNLDSDTSLVPLSII